MKPKQAPAFGLPLHSRCSRRLRSAVVSAESCGPFARFADRPFLRLLDALADELLELSADVCGLAGAFACTWPAVPARAAIASTMAGTKAENIVEIMRFMVGSSAGGSSLMQAASTWKQLIRCVGIGQAEIFTGPGTQVMVFAASAAKRPESIGGGVQAGTPTRGTCHLASNCWFFFHGKHWQEKAQVRSWVSNSASCTTSTRTSCRRRWFAAGHCFPGA